jgi:hypothetical protein
VEVEGDEEHASMLDREEAMVEDKIKIQDALLYLGYLLSAPAVCRRDVSKHQGFFGMPNSHRPGEIWRVG